MSTFRQLKVEKFIHKLENFKLWLNARGAEILVTTNEWEVLRFRTEKGTSVVYRNGKGYITFYMQAEEAWDAFRSNTSWRASPATKRTNRNKGDYDTLVARDGDRCFYCFQPVAEHDHTIEHLVALTHGGTKHISNKYLAHGSCNNDVGFLSAPEKIKLHTRKAIALAAAKMAELAAKESE